MDFIIFSKRFKLLRQSVGLSSRQLASYLSISYSLITYLEIGKKTPSIAALDNIVNFFGVSYEWLLGYSKYPYNEDLLLHLENELLKNLHGNTITIFPITVPTPDNQKDIEFPPEYLNQELRIKNYSHSLRANIIFLANCHKKFIEYFSYVIEHANTRNNLPSNSVVNPHDYATEIHELLKITSPLAAAINSKVSPFLSLTNQ